MSLYHAPNMLQDEIRYLRAEVERLTRERDELRVGIHDALRQIQTPGSPPSVPLGAFVAHYARLIRERAEAAERKLAEAREALAKYGQHKDGCKYLPTGIMTVIRTGRSGRACSCGLDDARAALGEGEKAADAAREERET